MTQAARLELHHITKAYPGVVANDGIDLSVLPGEVLAVLGENGAGKSTLMKIIYGAEAPDSGWMAFDGKKVLPESPAAARHLGIAMVHQHFALFETLTAAQNVVLGLDKQITLNEARSRIRELGERYGVPVDPDGFVADFTMGERQRVEIIRALMTSPRLLILDEPTSVLTPQAVQKLFATLKQLAAEGVSILFISHKLDEIRELADRCTVLRAGKVIATVNPKTETEESLARLMIGAEPPKLLEKRSAPGPVIFALKHVNFAHGRHICGLDDVNLEVRSGEIVGIAGISGNGQTRLLGVCAGELPVTAAEVELDHQPIGDLPPEKRRALGLRFVPEERLGHGSVPDFSLVSNSLLTGDRFRTRGFICRKAVEIFTREVINRFGVRPPDPFRAAGSLSGGNLQKYIVGREIHAEPRVLLIDQPTWGVDVGAAAVIHNALLELREKGAAIVVVSEEIDELFLLSDRIAVMHRGALSPAVDKNSISIEEVGRWMSGLWPNSPFTARSDAPTA